MANRTRPQIHIPAALHTRLKVKAALMGIAMGTLCEQILIEALERAETQEASSK